MLSSKREVNERKTFVVAAFLASLLLSWRTAISICGKGYDKFSNAMLVGKDIYKRPRVGACFVPCNPLKRWAALRVSPSQFSAFELSTPLGRPPRFAVRDVELVTRQRSRKTHNWKKRVRHFLLAQCGVKLLATLSGYWLSCVWPEGSPECAEPPAAPLSAGRVLTMDPSGQVALILLHFILIDDAPSS